MILIYVEFSCKYRTITEMQQVLDRERKITQVTNQLKEVNKGPKRKKNINYQRKSAEGVTEGRTRCYSF